MTETILIAFSTPYVYIKRVEFLSLADHYRLQYSMARSGKTEAAFGQARATRSFHVSEYQCLGQILGFDRSRCRRKSRRGRFGDQMGSRQPTAGRCGHSATVLMDRS